MAWEREYVTVVAGVSREAIWSAWSDVNHWHLWDADLERAHLDEAFATGARFTLRPKGGPTVKLRLVGAEPLESYTDFTQFPLARMYGTHEMREIDGGLELRCRIRVTGPLGLLWRKLVAEGVVRGLAAQTRALADYARARDVQHAS